MLNRNMLNRNMLNRNMLNRNKKAQTGGLVTGLIFGITSLVIGVIIAYVIISTLTSANLLSGSRTAVSVIGEPGHLNGSGYTLAEYSTTHAILDSFAISLIINDSGGLITIDSANYSLSGGVLSNITGDGYWDFVNISYGYSLYSDEELSTESLRVNLTEGIDNVASKVPTILLVAAIVLILGVLALLVGMWQRMRMGGGGTSI